jgi:hypothetical protein
MTAVRKKLILLRFMILMNLYCLVGFEIKIPTQTFIIGSDPKRETEVKTIIHPVTY